MDWITNNGDVVFKGKNSFGKAARRVWNERWGGRESHIRIGHFSCVVSPEMAHDYVTNRSRNEVVVARFYADADPRGDGSIKPGSQYWASSKAGRIQSISRVLQQLWSDHVLYNEIMADASAELLYLLTDGREG